MMKQIGIIGFGNLGFALSKGILKNEMYHILASKRNPIEHNLERFEWATNEQIIQNCDLIILAIKPYAVKDFFNSSKHFFKDRSIVLVSVVSGLNSKEFYKLIENSNVEFVRAMPNTAAEVKESMTALSFSETGKNNRQEVISLFDTIGGTLVIKEELMEAATIIGACGIAYVLRFMRAMIQGGVEVGFDTKTATEMVAQTIKGAAQLIIENKTHPEQEIDKVTTPKGCTIVGLNAMEHSGFSSSLIKGIVESFHKIEVK